MITPTIVTCGDCRWGEPINPDNVIGKLPGTPIMCYMHQRTMSAEQTCSKAEHIKQQ